MALRRQAALRRCTQGRTGWRQGQCWGWRVSHSLVVRPTRRQPSRRRLKARWHPRWHPQRLADKVRERRLHLRRQTHQPRHCCYCCHRARHRRRHRRTHTPAEASSAVGTVIAGLRSGLLEQQFRGRLRSTLPLSQCRARVTRVHGPFHSEFVPCEGIRQKTLALTRLRRAAVQDGTGSPGVFLRTMIFLHYADVALPSALQQLPKAAAAHDARTAAWYRRTGTAAPVGAPTAVDILASFPPVRGLVFGSTACGGSREPQGAQGGR